MDCLWLKTSPSLHKGVSIINQLDDTRFEQFVRRIVSKMKLQDTEIFNEDEIQKLVNLFNIEEENLLLAIKTLAYMFKRLLKYIFMPLDLKKDLKTIGICNEKADYIVKLWSIETKTTLDELGSSVISQPDTLDFSCMVNAELSSDYCKKTKVPKAYLTLASDKNTMIELTHSEMYSMFLQFETIQNELDNLGI